MLIRRGELDEGCQGDIRIHQDRIVEVAPALDPLPKEHVLDAGGGAVLPGLHDHHLHIRALAAALDSIVVGPPEVSNAEELADRLRREDRLKRKDAWLRAVDYHESVAGELDRSDLDRLVRRRPVR